MSKNIDLQYISLYHEFFEILLPYMIYEGNEGEKRDLLNVLWCDGKEVVHALFFQLCQENNVSYPFEEFKIKAFKKGGIRVVQILIPQYDINISNITGAYFLFTKYEGEIIYRKCFVIRRFENGRVFVMHITPEIKCLLGEEITEHSNDIEYEIWRVMNTYMLLVAQDMSDE